jgi:hypothetical protein
MAVRASLIFGKTKKERWADSVKGAQNHIASSGFTGYHSTKKI